MGIEGGGLEEKGEEEENDEIEVLRKGEKEIKGEEQRNT